MAADTVEQTLVLIKPDAIKLSLTGYLLSQLSEPHTGLRKIGLRIVHVTKMLAEEHYAEHRGKPFFSPLIDYIMGRAHYPDDPGRRRVVSIVYSGPNAVAKMRQIAGPTNPHVARDSAPGTVRALGTVVQLKDADGNTVGERMDNLLHASASAEEAEREIKLWFEPRNITAAMRAYPVKVCEGHYYFKAGRLLTQHEPGSVCLLAAGKMAWASDLEALELMAAGTPAPLSLDAIAAKYLSNRETELP
jgi:nucleoside-diphosphate kinase